MYRRYKKFYLLPRLQRLLCPGMKSLFVIVMLSLGSQVPVVFAQTVDTPTSSMNQFDAAIAHATRMPRLRGLLVSRQGATILEQYFNGSSSSDVVNIKSVSKSVISALVGIAIEQGYINDVDQPINKYFGDLISAESDLIKANITIEDLLTMQAGLASTSSRNYGAWVMSPDWIRYALKQPMRSPPGTRMEYSTGNTHLLSAILTQATAMTTLQFAREVLGQPMGYRLAAWPRDPKGIYFGGNDMEMTARQMLMFGQLYLNEGQLNGKQIVPAAWIKQSLSRHAQSTREHGRYYGYGWWIREMAGFETPYAWGYGGQFIILVPELDLVVVTTSDSTPGTERHGHRRDIQELVEKLIIMPIALSHQSRTARVDIIAQ
jgi:CubicO group peptidase (beta-lactamase class C family)